jgi:hypothetical protein
MRAVYQKAPLSHKRAKLWYTFIMTIQEIVNSEAYKSVVRDYRDVCLWFADLSRPPQNDIQLEQVLSSIETYGDAEAFRRVGRIRSWLSPHFSPKYSSGLPVRA